MDVAPGSGGLQPELSIHYNSGVSNGLLGVGFGLGGLSAIRRGGSVQAIDGRVSLSKGNGKYQFDKFTFPAPGTSPLSGDFNRDGLTDFIWANSKDDYGRVSSGNRFWAFLSRGDGRFWVSEVSIPLSSVFGSAHTLSVVATTDFDLDGVEEYVFAATDEKGRIKNSASITIEIGADERNHVTAVANGIGHRTEVEYALLTEPGLYTKGTTAEYPNAELMAPMTVVRATKEIGGVVFKDLQVRDAVRERRYHYTQARQNHAGYGFLGFRSIKMLDVEADTTTILGFEQDNVDALGMKTAEFVWAGPDMVSRVENKVGSISFHGGLTSFPYYVESVEDKYDLGGGGLGGEPYFASVVSNVSPDGKPGFDGFGNATYTKVETTANDETRTVVTTSLFGNDASRWLLGKVSESTTEFSGGEGPSISRTVGFTYHTGSGQLWRTQAHDGRVEGHHYDAFGNETQRTVVNYPEAGDVTTIKETDYDERGRTVVADRNALGHETRHERIHFGIGSPLESQDPNGLKTLSTFGPFGKLEKTVSQSPDENSQDLVRTTLTYAPEHLAKDWPEPPPGTALVSVKAASQQPTSLVFLDAEGRVLQTAKEGHGGRWIFQDRLYNERGLLVEQSRPYFAESVPQMTRSVYDAIGRPTQIVREDGVEVHFEYEGTRVTEIKDALGNKPRVQTTVYNGDKDVVEVIDGLGESLFLVRDAVGQVVRTVAGTGSHARVLTRMTFDAGGRQVELWDSNAGHKSFRYDRLGRRVLTVSRRDNLAGSIGIGEATRIEYDLLDRQVARTRGGGKFQAWLVSTAGLGAFDFDDDAAKHSSFVYDEGKLGTLTRSTTEEGVRRLHFYDDWVRPAGERLQLGALDGPPVYDSLGRIVSGYEFKRTIQYDEWGRPSVEIYSQSRPTAVDFGSIHHKYDDLSLVSQVLGRKPGQGGLSVLLQASRQEKYASI